jgi:hypothetical protein
MTFEDLFPPNKDHCVDVFADRKLGKKWERNFCALVAEHHRGCLTPHQFAQTGNAAAAYWKSEEEWKVLLLPDITLWRAPGEHHEIKHKNPTPGSYRCYGLEQYRLEALYKFATETRQHILYTIHDWEKAGAKTSRDETPNRIEDWFTADISQLYEQRLSPSACYTWRNGSRVLAPVHFWSVELWTPLKQWWDRSRESSSWTRRQPNNRQLVR